MEFTLNKSQKDIQKAARDFAKGKFDRILSTELERDNLFPFEIWEDAGELGFIAMHYPENLSGQSLEFIDQILVVEEFCRKDSTIGSAITLTGYGAEGLLKFGDEPLKNHFLSAIPLGNAICGLAIQENTRIYEKSEIATTAIKEKDEWVLNGEKTYVINGGKSTFFLVLCRNVATDGSSGGTNLILVEKNAPGLEIMELGEKMGLRMTPMAHIRLNNTKVPFSNIIGNDGQGDSIINAVMNHNRVWLAGMALGTAQGAFDRALDYVKKRAQFGKKIVEFQVTRQKLAEMAVKIQQARDMTYIGAVSCDSGKPDGKLTAMAKLTACRAAVEVASEAIQLMGGYGYITEYDVERFYRDAKAMEILSENPTMLKDRIAGNIIGKI